MKTMRSSMGKRTMSRSTARPAPPPLVAPKTMPQGKGIVGTASNPSPQPPGTAGVKTPNSGGIIEGPGTARRTIAPDAGYTGPLATGNTGPGPNTSQVWRSGTARPAPAPMTPANRPAQTERADPLNGAGGPPQVPGTSRTVSQAPEIDPGKALGASTRGNMTPAGEDRHPLEDKGTAPDGQPGPGEEDLDKDANDEETIGGHIGGSGAMARKFSNPSSAGAYDQFASSASGQPPPARIFSGRSTGKSSASMLKKGNPRDNGDESSGGEDY